VGAPEGQKEREQLRLGNFGLGRPCPRVRATSKEGERAARREEGA
jgi:hypothetical protein